MLELEENINGIVDLVSPSRELLKHGKVFKISARTSDHQERYLFLVRFLLNFYSNVYSIVGSLYLTLFENILRFSTYSLNFLMFEIFCFSIFQVNRYEYYLYNNCLAV